MNIKLILLAVLLSLQKDPGSTRDAMKPVQLLVGEWRAQVSSDDGKAEAWEETQAWEYKIEKEEYALQFTAKDGKHFKDGVLSYDLKKKTFRLDVTRMDDKKAGFEGKLEGKDLVLEEVGDDKAPRERITWNFLRDNRFIGETQKKEAGGKSWSRTAALQFTKQGVPFVKSEAPKCLVTGGTGSIEVAYQGKTYYVC